MSVYAPRLRIAIDPVYVQAANLTSSSTYQKYVTLVRELVSRGHFVYWLIPDNEYVPNLIEDHPNVGVIRTGYIQDQFVVDGLVTDQFFNLFNRVAGKYHIDVLLTSRTSLALMYKRLLEPPRFHDTDDHFTDKGYGLPTMVIEEFPQTRERQHVSRSYWLMQCQGYIGADRTVFLSDHNRSEVVKEMQDIFTRSYVTDFVDRTRIVPSGIETKELDKYYDAERWKLRRDKFRVLSIGRLVSVGHLHFLPWFDYLFKSGHSDVELTISLSGALGGPMRAKLANIGLDMENSVGRQFKIMENNPRKNFLAMIKGYSCFVAPMSHLDHPTGLFEAIYLGLPGIIPVADYQKTFFQDWPFVIEPKDRKGFLAMLMWLRDNQEEARHMILPWRDRIREKYDAPTNIRILADDIEQIARDKIDKFKTSKGVVDLCKELKGERYRWDDIIAFLKKSGRMGVSVGDLGIRTTFTYARSAVHHAMRLAGYVDVCDGPDDYYVRRDIFEKEYGNGKAGTESTARSGGTGGEPQAPSGARKGLRKRAKPV